ncbi:hypothetical protein AXI59_08335 [Bacillus nakamurai]|uniref:DnaJ homologue subfamily C member 28 conserved domain-containing protein n=1 Tax=Bacillus nakamurai TaxID=1793963 RepID=A0A150FDT3_9BACI|nr:DUF1992 domain-containing protein [Bacillus nakamurai]KXZ22715.1 hypothetical protein AXI58_08040 [Bacillus nakamurai]KXZ23587.1 hypothetical protein AXI59_08335 [Bacillus nakamurai]MCC9022444.1 DUF1992 domain-containing protein [Bacillus nakamurai]MCP6683977.1 DUF1992 domain-containing protein [Bacillus nakamurai]MED1226268.1 DUF1992 domain-containing protein [Bacillus nakamurai]
MDIAHIVAEDKIKRAIKDGEFQSIKGMGQPLPKDDAAHLPESLRMGYRLLKNAGMAEDEGALKKELMTLDHLIAKCRNETELEHLEKKRTEKQVRLDQLIEKKEMFSKPASSHYKEKVYKRFGRP